MPTEATDAIRRLHLKLYFDLVLKGVSIVQMREEERMATKGYVVFSNDELPWRDETTLYVVRDAEPRHVVPALADTLQALVAVDGGTTRVKPSWPNVGALPVIAANHLIAQKPMNFLPHSRVLLHRPDETLGKQEVYPSRHLHGIYTEERVPPMVHVDWLYEIKCLQEMKNEDPYVWGPAWRVKVLKWRPLTKNPCKEIDSDGRPADGKFEVAHEEMSLEELAALVSRLNAFAELGGKPENY